MKAVIVLIFVVASAGAHAQQAEIVKLQRITQLLEIRSGKVQVINFWATWCAPCIKELPLFEKLNTEGRPDVNVTLVSLDLDLDPNPEKVYNFIARKKILSRVLILDEKDPNSWIDKVSELWSGALPATLVINTETGKRQFVERELKEGELEKIIASVQ